MCGERARLSNKHQKIICVAVILLMLFALVYGYCQNRQDRITAGDMVYRTLAIQTLTLNHMRSSIINETPDLLLYQMDVSRNLLCYIPPLLLNPEITWRQKYDSLYEDLYVIGYPSDKTPEQIAAAKEGALSKIEELVGINQEVEALCAHDDRARSMLKYYKLTDPGFEFYQSAAGEADEEGN
ncbi:MAG: hypothetical protein Q4C22_06745 [Bacillota bacterium]|nr:hypothetical protein [Bacillota bacterium]